MVHDDDTGRHLHNKIDSAHGRDDGRTSSQPSKAVEEAIIAMVRNSGWGVERIHEWFRARNRHDVTKSMIRYVIARARNVRRL
jgi:hypothetical protein